MLLYVWDIPQLCSYYILHMHTVDGENPAPENNLITTWAVARGEDVWLAATLWNLLGLCQAPLEHARPLACRQQGWCGVTIFQHGYDINGLEPTIDGYVTQLKSMAFPYLCWFATRQMSSAQNWSVFFLQVALPAIGMITCEQLSSTQHNEIKYTKNKKGVVSPCRWCGIHKNSRFPTTVSGVSWCGCFAILPWLPQIC